MLWNVSQFPFFSRLDNIPLLLYAIFLTHSPVDGHLGCFYLLVIVNDSMNVVVQVYIRDHALNSFESISRNGIAGSYSNFIFNFLRNFHTVFQ